jgi:SAM-dependent methyltransferase
LKIDHCPLTINYSFLRYLAAKKPIDDRALNQHVWDTMVNTIQPATNADPLRILEIGCGTGTMLERLLERGLGKNRNIHYIGIDSDPSNITHARQDFSNSQFSTLHSPTFVHTDLFSLPNTIQKKSFDLLLAHAVLDLVDVFRALPILFSYLRPGGVYYFTLNFDGESIFQPEHPLDPLIVTLYHQTMDKRITDGHPSGDSGLPYGGSQTGRHLFAHLKNAGAEILAAGSSDWVVFPRQEGYSPDETYFLHHILHFFEEALIDQPELEAGQLAEWLATRHEQVERQELVYVAHQLDFVGRFP